MELLIAILFQLGVNATPELLNNNEFVRQNQHQIERAVFIEEGHRYRTLDGGIVIDTDVSP